MRQNEYRKNGWNQKLVSLLSLLVIGVSLRSLCDTWPLIWCLVSRRDGSSMVVIEVTIPFCEYSLYQMNHVGWNRLFYGVENDKRMNWANLVKLLRLLLLLIVPLRRFRTGHSENAP